VFKSNNVIFQDLITKKKIGEEFLENDFYFLNSNKFILNIRKEDDLHDTWHKRVEHPSDKILKNLFNFSLVDCSKCEVCKLSKHTKLSFCNSNSTSNEILELIHSDV
jgi:GAG-pre-integrase domain